MESTASQENRIGYGISITVVCPVIALIFIALRIYTRAFLVKKVYWEDYTIIAAMVFSIFLDVFVVIVPFQLTQHAFAQNLQFMPAVCVGYTTTHTLLKLSIVLQYLRICVMRFERYFCYVLMALLGCGFCTFVAASLRSCVPLYALWTPNVPGAQCLSPWWDIASLSWIMAMDFIILIGPLFILRHLTIPWPQRVVLGLVLALGTLASTISLLRLLSILGLSSSTDLTWDAVPSSIYGVTETNLGIACACVVTLRPLYKRLRRWSWLSSAGGEPEPSQVEQQQQQQQRAKRRRHHQDSAAITVLADATDETETLGDDVELAVLNTHSPASCFAEESSCGSGSAKDPTALEKPPPAWVRPTAAAPSPALAVGNQGYIEPSR
ncbi:hypothetical protein MAPG_02429 [Magnaporthiopsis poae ATCC 64411]|uniref:Rhodopsin domain-containing protein n=1 Tax=Magnaporthiopsis poae (strain ATCC 64411 / 73-15) TaxID=644358 RepID=A0A0C4DRC1_MAGP6|nr:hypothetical protein MAPG_02429 [Magnaporthiopsis poae ATCC 64411]